jgi:hypothetical protein
MISSTLRDEFAFENDLILVAGDEEDRLCDELAYYQGPGLLAMYGIRT